MFFVFKRTFNYRYMFYDLLLCAYCMDCVHSLVWYVEETYVVASYKADILLSTASYLLHTNMCWNLYMLYLLVY